MEALSREFRTGCPWELLYANGLVFVAESLGELKVRLKNWKDGLEEKGLKVNVGKTRTSLVLYTQRLESEDCICQIPMWYMYERLWSQFNPLSCRNCVHKFKKL